MGVIIFSYLFNLRTLYIWPPIQSSFRTSINCLWDAEVAISSPNFRQANLKCEAQYRPTYWHALASLFSDWYIRFLCQMLFLLLTFCLSCPSPASDRHTATNSKTEELSQWYRHRKVGEALSYIPKLLNLMTIFGVHGKQLLFTSSWMKSWVWRLPWLWWPHQNSL